MTKITNNILKKTSKLILSNICNSSSKTYLETSKNFKLFNKTTNRRELENILSQTFYSYGSKKACYLADFLKTIGFKYATKAALSISLEDLKVPSSKKKLLKETQLFIKKIEDKYAQGEITESEWFQKQIEIWSLTGDKLKTEILDYFEKTDPLNPIFIMAFSGARGNISQVRQLIGMRGLMADQKGDIISLPILQNFREGLTITDYLISSYGARKGIVDTALKTADAGYLTRRLIDVVQNIIIREVDCGTSKGICLAKYHKNFQIPFSNRIIGRITSIPIKNKNLNIEKNILIDKILAKKIESSSILKLNVRSPLTCNLDIGVCQKCYGWDLAKAKLIKLGEAIGIIAAQSMGEPATQLTLRTFHTGGTFTSRLGQEIRLNTSGQIYFSEFLKSHTNFTRRINGDYAQKLKKNGQLTLVTYQNQKIEFLLFSNTLLVKKNKDFIKKNEIFVEIPIFFDQETEEEVEKKVYSKFSGEIYFQSKYFIWVIASEVKKLDKNLDFQFNFKNLPKINLYQTFGKINISNNFFKANEQIMKGLYLENNFILLNNIKFKKKYNDNNNNNIFREIETLKKIFFLKKNILDTNFFTKVRGKVYNINIIYKELNFSIKLQTGGTFFWIPSSIVVKKKKFQNKFKNIFHATKIFQCPKNFKDIQKLNKKILFLNEKLFNVKIKHLSFIEILVFEKQTYIILKPIKPVRIKKQNSIYNFLHKKLNFFLPNNFLLSLNEINYFLKENFVLNKNELFLKKYGIETKFNLFTNCNLSFYQLENSFFYKPNKNNNDIENKTFFRIFKNQIIQPYAIIKNTFLLRKQTKKIFLISQKSITFQDLQQLSIITEKNASEIYLDEKDSFKKNQEFFLKKDFLSNEIKLKNPSRLLIKKGSQIILRTANPYLFSENAVIEKTSKDFILKNESLGTLVFKVLKTQDIVQGLPKIEEVLEARIPKSNSPIIEKSGFITNLDFQNGPLTFKVLSIKNETDDLLPLFRLYDLTEKFNDYDDDVDDENDEIYDEKSNFGEEFEEEIDDEVEENEKESLQEKTYIFENFKDYDIDLLATYKRLSIGQKLNKSTLNPHEALAIYFCHFLMYYSPQIAAKKSFLKIAPNLIDSIQTIYWSQGINMSAKHLEIILKQMMTKVEIVDPGESNLLEGEFLDIYFAEKANKTLFETGKIEIIYKPKLLGISKTSLITESFLSAASFQQTTKVLTSAAIEGKIDWIKGLKENVMIGNLIPAGTGFRQINLI